jgi:hypothetical protein
VSSSFIAVPETPVLNIGLVNVLLVNVSDPVKVAKPVEDKAAVAHAEPL